MNLFFNSSTFSLNWTLLIISEKSQPRAFFAPLCAKKKRFRRTDGPKDGPMDRQTDQQTDIPSYRDAIAAFKNGFFKTRKKSVFKKLTLATYPTKTTLKKESGNRIPLRTPILSRLF